MTPTTVSLSNLLDVDAGVQKTLRDVIKKEMVLEFKFENVLELLSITTQFPPPTPCGCMATNEAGHDFDINRGNGAANTTVTFNGTVEDPPGAVTYNGHICLDCATDNSFTFEYGGSTGVAAFTFTATTFDVPHCPADIVTVTGQGTITAGTNVFGPNPVYSLTLNGVTPKSISIVITGNGNTFTATVAPLGNGELVVTNCP
jgi:hypothetical protein